MFFSNQSSDDETLLQHLRQNGSVKTTAEDRLFQRYRYFIEEGSRKYNLTSDEAFDAYSDTVLAGIADVSSGVFKGSSSLKTYLFRIFQNKCVDIVRRKMTKKNKVNQALPLFENIFQLADGAKSVLQRLADKADLDLLRQKMTELGDTCRRVLQFSAEGRSDREIAELMEFKTADVVKTTRLRCLGKLRALYNIPR